MKKLFVAVCAVILVLASGVSTFATGINTSEDKVLDALQTSVEMKNGTMVIPDAYVNQAENYFNTIDMTEEEASDIIAIINEGKTFLENTGAANIKDMEVTKKYELLEIGKRVVGVIDMTMTYDKTTKTLYIYDPDGNTAFAATPYLTPDGDIADSNVIKPTGSNNMVIPVIVGTGVILTAFCVAFIVYSKKRSYNK